QNTIIRQLTDLTADLMPSPQTTADISNALGSPWPCRLPAVRPRHCQREKAISSTRSSLGSAAVESGEYILGATETERLAGRSTKEGQANALSVSWIRRHSYHSIEPNVKDKNLENRVIALQSEGRLTFCS